MFIKDSSKNSEKKYHSFRKYIKQHNTFNIGNNKHIRMISKKSCESGLE